jgi:hypothetical protein
VKGDLLLPKTNPQSELQKPGPRITEKIRTDNFSFSASPFVNLGEALRAWDERNGVFRPYLTAEARVVANPAFRRVEDEASTES